MADGVVEYILRLTDKTKAGTRSALKGSQDLEDQTKQTSEAIDDLGEEAKRAAAAVDDLGDEARRAGRKVDDFGDDSKGASKSVDGLVTGLKGLGAALAVDAVLGALTAAAEATFDFGNEVAELRTEITATSVRSGIAAETLQGIRLAAEGAGVGFEELVTDLDNFGRMMRDASSGTGAQAEAFDRLGVAVVDAQGDLRNVDTVFRETLSALAALPGGAERGAIALDLFGGAGGRLIQALGGNELQDFVDLSASFGIDVGPKAATAARRWQRASAELSTVLDGLKGQLFDAAGGADTLFALSEAAIYLAEVGGGAIEGFTDGMARGIDRALEPFDRLIAAISNLLESLTMLSEGDFTGALQRLAQAQFELQEAALSTPAAVLSGLTAGMVEGAIEAGEDALIGLDRAAMKVQELRSLRVADQEPEPDGGGGRRDTEQGVDSATELAAQREALTALAGSLGVRTAVDRAPSQQDVEMQRRNEAFLESLVAETRASRLEAAQTGIGAATQLLGGDAGGAISSIAGATGMAGLGVAGAAISGLQFIGEQGAEGIEDTLNGVKDGLIAALEALPELIGDILPQFAISLVTELIPALIEAGPEILKSLIVDLPVAIAQALGRILRETFGRGENRGRNIGAAIGGVGGFILAGPVGAAAGAGAGAAVGAATQDIIEGRRGSRGRDAARTASDGQAGTARAADRLALQSTRRRRTTSTVQSNPFDQLAQQFDNQFGTYGRASAATIGAT